MITRAEIIDRIWEAAEPEVFIPKAAFMAGLDSWDIQPVEIDGEMAFVTMTNGPAFHFHSFDTGHAISRRMIKDFLKRITDHYGYATTKTPKEDTRQHRFNLMFGFKVVGMDEYDIFYRIDRSGPCQ
jgi:hypothetical protein